MFWRTQTQRDIANLEAEVRDLQQKYYSTQADLSRLLECLKLVRTKTPEQTTFAPVGSEIAKQYQAWLYSEQNAMFDRNSRFFRQYPG